MPSAWFCGVMLRCGLQARSTTGRRALGKAAGSRFYSAGRRTFGTVCGVMSAAGLQARSTVGKQTLSW